MTAANLGWHVTYLGASPPVAEIASAARQKRTQAVALGLVYPQDHSRLESKLARLREYLQPEVVIVVGGRTSQQRSGTTASCRFEICGFAGSSNPFSSR
jgi:methylmalonyl-CoA mutase cobalamin-binding subunit